MKKMIGIAAFCMAVSISQAVSFSWGLEDMITSFGSEAVGGVTLNLVYLGGAGSTYSINGFTVENPVARVSGEGVSTATSMTDEGLEGYFFGADYGHGLGNQVGSSASDVLTAGDSTFGLVMYYTDTNGKTWINIASDTYTLPSGVEDITTGLEHSFAANWTKNAEGTALTAGGGWTTASSPVIPEPGVACMALLGIGMMLKRRRA